MFVFDRVAMVGFVLSVTRSLLARLEAMGGPPPGGVPIAIVAAGSAVHATGAAPAISTGRDMPMRFLPVPVTLQLAEIVERLNAIQPPALFGYPSMLARLAVEQRSGRLRIAPLVITSTSETLLHARTAITEAFGVPVVDGFGSMERRRPPRSLTLRGAGTRRGDRRSPEGWRPVRVWPRWRRGAPGGLTGWLSWIPHQERLADRFEAIDENHGERFGVVTRLRGAATPPAPRAGRASVYRFIAARKLLGDAAELGPRRVSVGLGPRSEDSGVIGQSRSTRIDAPLLPCPV